jgi:hypothetical protein
LAIDDSSGGRDRKVIAITKKEAENAEKNPRNVLQTCKAEPTGMPNDLKQKVKYVTFFLSEKIPAGFA